MEKINFQDYPNTNTPINSTNLNVLQDNIELSINEHLPILLFNGDSKESITLQDNAQNYSYIEIFYRQNQNFYNSVKVFQPNSKAICLLSMAPTSTAFWLQSRIVKIDGTTIDTYLGDRYGQKNLASNSSTYSAENNIYITRVVGYK